MKMLTKCKNLIYEILHPKLITRIEAKSTLLDEEECKYLHGLGFRLVKTIKKENEDFSTLCFIKEDSFGNWRLLYNQLYWKIFNNKINKEIKLNYDTHRESKVILDNIDKAREYIKRFGFYHFHDNISTNIKVLKQLTKDEFNKISFNIKLVKI